MPARGGVHLIKGAFVNPNVYGVPFGRRSPRKRGPYSTPITESGQRTHSLREVFNGLRYIVKTGAPWRWMPHHLPPWAIVYQQAQRWL